MAIARVVERESSSRESSRIVDYNAPPNSCTFGRAQQEFWLSLGLSNKRHSSI